MDIEKLVFIRKFFNKSQFLVFMDYISHSEEKKFFKSQVNHFYSILKQVPKLYGQDCKQEKIAYLHYFTPNADWYVLEVNEDTGEMFGLVKMYGNYPEYGYFYISELISVNAEFDMYFEPINLKNIKI